MQSLKLQIIKQLLNSVFAGFVACEQAQGEGIVGLQGRRCILQNAPFYNTPHSHVNCQKRTNYRNPKIKQTRIKMLRGLLCLFGMKTIYS